MIIKQNRKQWVLFSEINYYGDMSYYSIVLEGITDPLSVSMRNTAGRKVLKPNDQIRVGWGAESLILLD